MQLDAEARGAMQWLGWGVAAQIADRPTGTGPSYPYLGLVVGFYSENFTNLEWI
jgi:hypothetical protein